MRCNRNKLAQLLGRDVKTIDRMVRDGMPCVSRPGQGQQSWVFDTAAVLAWMTRDAHAERDKASRSKLLEAKAGIKWLEYGKALGFLVSIDDVRPKFEELMQYTKSRLVALPGRYDQLLSVESDPAVIQEILEREINDIFEQMDRMTKAALDHLPR